MYRLINESSQNHFCLYSLSERRERSLLLNRIIEMTKMQKMREEMHFSAKIFGYIKNL